MNSFWVQTLTWVCCRGSGIIWPLLIKEKATEGCYMPETVFHLVGCLESVHWTKPSHARVTIFNFHSIFKPEVQGLLLLLLTVFPYQVNVITDKFKNHFLIFFICEMLKRKRILLGKNMYMYIIYIYVYCWNSTCTSENDRGETCLSKNLQSRVKWWVEQPIGGQIENRLCVNVCILFVSTLIFASM